MVCPHEKYSSKNWAADFLLTENDQIQDSGFLLRHEHLTVHTRQSSLGIRQSLEMIPANICFLPHRYRVSLSLSCQGDSAHIVCCVVKMEMLRGMSVYRNICRQWNISHVIAKSE